MTRPASHTPTVSEIDPISGHTLGGSPPGNLRELTLRRGEPIVRFTITALGSAVEGHLVDVDSKVLGCRATRVLEPGTPPVDDSALPILNEPAPTRGTR